MMPRRKTVLGFHTLAMRLGQSSPQRQRGVRRSGAAGRLFPFAVIFAIATQLLCPPPANGAYLFKIITVPPNTATATTGALGATGLAGCTPVSGTTGSVTIAPKHGTVTLVPTSGPQPNCGSAVFTGVQANYTWTDTTGMPGSGSDYFRITFTDAAGKEPQISDITIFLNANGKAGCTCPDPAPAVSAKDPAQTADRLGQVQAGDPVDVGTGNVSYHVTDYSTSGQNPLAFIRTYNSNASITGFAQSAGANWRSNFDRYVDILSPNTVNVERGNGQVLSFYLNGTSWVPESDVDVSLVQSGSNWKLTDENDTVETYVTKTLPLAGGPLAVSPNAAQITSIKFRNGYTQTLSYNGLNQLASVTDSYGRTLSFTYSGGLLQTLTTPDNTTISYGYGTVALPAAAAGKLILNSAKLASVTYPTTPVSTQTYLYENASLPFALTGVIDENGNRYASWTYDSQGRGLTNQLGSGVSLTTITYDDSTGNRTVTNALSQQEIFKFTMLQHISKVSEIDRLATATTTAAKRLFTYDANGYLASQTDWNGNRTTYTNNIHGLPTTINEATGTPVARATTVTYDATLGHLPRQIVTPGLTIAFTYDASGNPLTRTQTDTTTTTVPYRTGAQTRPVTMTWSNGLLASVKTPNGNTTSFTYDGSGAPTGIADALGHQASITAHTGGGLPQTIVDPNGVTTTLAYDARQRPLSSTIVTASGPLVTAHAYDPAGNLLSTTLPDGSMLTNSFDDAHRLTGTSDLLGQSVAYALDALGDPTQVRLSDPSGVAQFQRQGAFDALAQLIRTIGGAGQTATYAYDANGNGVKITDSLGRVTSRTFDPLNRLTRITDAAGGVTAIAYDAHDRPLSVTDPNGNATAYTYDGFGDVIQEVSPDRGTIVYRYDGDASLIQRVDAAGTITNITYDVLDRPLTRAYPSDASQNIGYVYDEASSAFGIGRLTSLTDAAGSLQRSYDERGNLITETRVANGATLMTSYGYDAAGRVASITYPSGWTVTYSRDVMGRITSANATSPDGIMALPVVSNVGYQPFGPLNALTFGNGIQHVRNFDMDYRLTALADAGASAVQGLNYGYDAANNVLSIGDVVTPGSSQNFGYDAMDRLTNASGSYGGFAWTYDKVGNRLTETLGGVATAYGYTAKTNRLASITAGGTTTPVSYTRTGNISAIPPTPGAPTATLTYNASDRLASVTGTPVAITGMLYDAFGRRVSKADAGSNPLLYTYDQSGRLHEETDGSGTLIDYIYLGNLLVAELQPLTGRAYFLHGDRLGTPQLVTDGVQNIVWSTTYKPFGETAIPVGSITQNLRFPGQYFDAETGWHQNGSRDYIPTLGRYAQSDQMGLGGGPNTYIYAGASPSGRIDPYGLSAESFGYGFGEGVFTSVAIVTLVPAEILASPAFIALGVGSLVYGGYEAYLAYSNGCKDEGDQILGNLLGGFLGGIRGRNIWEDLGTLLSDEYGGGNLFGANGPRIFSKTVWKGPNGERIDIENTAPGERPANIHFQQAGQSFKYYFDPILGTFLDAPNSVNNFLRNPNVQRAIQKALHYLGN